MGYSVAFENVAGGPCSLMWEESLSRENERKLGTKEFHVV